MDSGLRHAWTQIVTGEDYDDHMARIGQAQAGADLTCQIIRSADPPSGGHVVIAGAGTGQVLDFLDPALFRTFHLTFTDLNPAFLARLAQRLVRHGLVATVLEDDIGRPGSNPARISFWPRFCWSTSIGGAASRPLPGFALPPAAS